jgi:hypothetical protein
MHWILGLFVDDQEEQIDGRCQKVSENGKLLLVVFVLLFMSSRILIVSKASSRPGFPSRLCVTVLRLDIKNGWSKLHRSWFAQR